MSKRMTKGELDEMRTLGALNPVGHAILVVANDSAASEAKDALAKAGFAPDDILSYSAGELFPNLKDMMREASGAAGFGYEITLMRRYMTLASEGCVFLIVYAPEDAQSARLAEIAKRLGVRSAVHYGRLASEELL
jgi:hypothetical protein